MGKQVEWRSRQESNLYLPLRRRPFYPLNYGSGAMKVLLNFFMMS